MARVRDARTTRAGSHAVAEVRSCTKPPRRHGPRAGPSCKGQGWVWWVRATAHARCSRRSLTNPLGGFIRGVTAVPER
eukprot:1434078-Prymnesium_polylepis.1